MKNMKQEQKDRYQIYGFILLAAVVVTIIMLPLSIVNVPSLKPGQVSPINIRSPYTLKIKDIKATQKLKEESKRKVLPVLKYVSIENQVIKNVEDVGNFTDNEKKYLKEILKLYYRRGIVDQIPEGYSKVKVLTKNGEKVEDAAKFVRLNHVRNYLKQDLSQFVGEKRAGEIAEKIEKLLKPNYVYQKELTETLWSEAESKVKPVYITLKKGEIVVRKGERVTPEVAVKIKLIREEKEKGRGINKYLALGVLSLILFYLIVKLYKVVNPSAFNVKNVLFSFFVVTLDIFLIRVFTYLAKLIVESLNLPLNEHLLYVPIVTSTIFASMFITKKVALIHIFPVSMLPSFLLPKPELFIVPMAIGGIFSCFDSRRYRSREMIYKSAFTMGFFLSLLQEMLLVYYYGLAFKPENVAFPILSMIGAGIAAIVVNGLSPLLINIFKFTTDMVYMELINLNHPLLRKLVLKAPGTYSHSVMVATLAEAAAETIGANALLAKAGGLFHDIGKLKNPQAFIENQTNGINIHDKLPPEKSAAILRSHVEYGEELGRKYNLPEKVIDIIKQHHGTKLMKYFYHKAKELYGDKVDEKKFRYPGPKPQFKEAGIVLLADTVEAAVRSMKDKDFDLDEVIHKLIMDEIEDGQLTQSGLSLRDIALIEKVFKKVLSGIYHNRIEYPEEENGGKNGRSR